MLTGAFIPKGCPIRAMEHPRFRRILLLQVQNVHDPISYLRIQNREHQLNTAIQISRHPVRTGQIGFAFSIVVEMENAGMLQETSHDGSNSDIL